MRRERDVLATVADVADALPAAARTGGEIALAFAPGPLVVRPVVRVIPPGAATVGVVVIIGATLIQTLAASLAVAETAAAIQTLVSTLLDRALRDVNECEKCIARSMLSARSGSARVRIRLPEDGPDRPKRQISLTPSP